jgi:glycosyltransferase involved in cell wall biosynthesis
MGMLSADPHRYTPPPFPDPELVYRLRRLIRRFRPEIVHSYGWLSYSAAVAMLDSSIPVLLSTRDYGYVCPVRTLIRQGANRGELCSGPAFSKCLECAGAFYGQPKATAAVVGVLGGRPVLRRWMRGLHSPSRFAQKMMHQHLVTLGNGTPDVVIPDFHDAGPSGPPDEGVLSQLPQERFILFVGSFSRIKGDQLLIEAYSRLESPPPLVMIGRRAPEPLPAFPDGVTPLFDVSHETVMAVWDRALFGVFPSVVPETLGNVVHEAMSRGRTVIGTRPGGHEDIIDDGVSGLLVAAGDADALTAALRLLLDDPDLRGRMEAAAVVRAQAFTAEAVMSAMQETYYRTVCAARRVS